MTINNTNNETLTNNTNNTNNEGDTMQQQMTVCEGCGCEFHEDELIEMSDTGRKFCKECASDCYVCSDCGAHTEHNYGDDDTVLCEDCRDSYYTECEHCGRIVNSDDTTTVETVSHSYRTENETWCNDCRDRSATCCYSCEEWVRTEDTYLTHYGDYICRSCYEDSYGCCEDCGEVYHIDDLYWNESRQCYLCSNCDYDESEDYVHGYSYKPIAEFFGDDTSLFFGVELEVGGASSSDMSDAAEELHTANTFYLKSDCSIPNCGFEIVTHPCTYKYHKESFGWDSVTTTCRNNGLRGHDLGSDTCGMHIHCSRNFMSETRWCVFEYFLTKTQKEWAKIARRRSHWGKFKSQSFTGRLSRSYGRRGQEDRYVAVNFYNSHTVELRIFRSTLKASTITATIGAVDAACRFIKQISLAEVKQNGNLWKAYCQFLTNNSGDYAEVIEHLKHLDIWC